MAKNHRDWVSMLLKEVTCARATSLDKQKYYKTHKISFSHHAKERNQQSSEIR